MPSRCSTRSRRSPPARTGSRSPARGRTGSRPTRTTWRCGRSPRCGPRWAARRAAGALVACNELWHSGLDQQQLGAVAAKVGSDVAFALLGGTAVGRGRGERLTPALAPATPYHWVLAFADGYLSTPEVYAALDRLRAAEAGAPKSPKGPNGPSRVTGPKGATGSKGAARSGAAEPDLDAALMSALR